jgi:hypothetical protein
MVEEGHGEMKPKIFSLNFYINGDMRNVFKKEIDYAPFKMAYVISFILTHHIVRIR